MSIGKRISDGLLPENITKILYKNFVKVGEAYINGWSFMHLFSGIITSLYGYNLWAAIIIHSLWELFQTCIGDNSWDLETMYDIPLDTAFFMFGWWIGRKIVERK
jgi:hypothetical protein